MTQSGSIYNSYTKEKILKKIYKDQAVIWKAKLRSLFTKQKISAKFGSLDTKQKHRFLYLPSTNYCLASVLGAWCLKVAKKISYDVKLLKSNYHVMETLSIRVAHKKVGTLCKNWLPL